MTKTQTGILYGIGVGPGDPELLTLKAVRYISDADLVCYVVNEAGESRARNIAAAHIRSEAQEIPFLLPMQTDRDAAQHVYDKTAVKLATALSENKRVAVLCEGDPFFYGSFINLYDRLAQRYSCQIVPGVISVNAAAATAGLPLCQMSDTLAIVSSRNSDADISQVLADHNGVAILKAGPQRKRILNLIRASNRWHEAIYLEHIGIAEQKVYNNLDDVPTKPGPYFSLFLLSRYGHP